jgi:hypothetical protein
MELATSKITPAQVAILRKLTKDADYRKAFFRDPQGAVYAEGLIGAEATYLSRITPLEIDGLHRAALAVGRGRAEDSCTLVYAVAFAVAFALLFAAADTARGDISK